MIINNMNKPKYELVKVWNYYHAEIEYKLYKVSGRSKEELASGDLDWCEATAKHFDLEVPVEETTQ